MPPSSSQPVAARVTTPRIGVMQGRLSPRPGERLQAFPWNSWREEFPRAKTLGFDFIEWIFEVDRCDSNPLWSPAGRAEIQRIARDAGVQVGSICADYFMERRLSGTSGAALAQAQNVLKRLIDCAADVGAHRILVPLVEGAALGNQDLEEDFIDAIQGCLPAAMHRGVYLALEMEIPGKDYAAFVDRCGHPCVKACYDTGNSAAQGFPIAADVVPVLSRLHAVHVKDRKVSGTSQPLGRGDADLRGFFRVLRGHNFTGDIVLQHYFGDDFLGDAKDSLRFVRTLLGAASGEAA
jgi:L-ribulose-5-phosphate 3-epimerase